ncbi:MAG: hypothetical protein RIB60_03570 [Phycisphaerales bacterium]
MAARFEFKLGPEIERIESREVSLAHQAIIYEVLAHTTESYIHQLQGQSGNTVYLHEDGHREAVYDADGDLVQDGINDGSYNYAHPVEEPLLHFTLDISPWIQHGASERDPTAVEERIIAYLSDLEGGIRRAHASGTVEPLADHHEWTEQGQVEALAIFVRAIQLGDAPGFFQLFEPGRELTDDDILRVLTALNAGFNEIY